jgi:hypothetical protein
LAQNYGGDRLISHQPNPDSGVHIPLRIATAGNISNKFLSGKLPRGIYEKAFPAS